MNATTNSKSKPTSKTDQAKADRIAKAQQAAPVTTATKAEAAPHAAQAPAAPDSKPVTLSKAQRIAALPADMAVADVVKALALEGLVITPAYVSSVRASIRRGHVPGQRGTGTRTGSGGGGARGPVVHRTAASIQKRAISKLQKERDALAKWHDPEGKVAAVLVHVDAALKSAKTAVDELTEFPTDYQTVAPKEPKAGRAPKEDTASSLAEGQHVAIREKYRADFELILGKDEMDELVVKAQRGKKVICRGPNGDTLLLDRRQLELRTAQG
jgi:hypothetical protein